MEQMTSALLDRAVQYARLARLHRPIGNFLLLWPMLWALWIAAAGRPDPRVLGVFLLGVLVMRAAGCVINDYADRHFDGRVKRTRDRPMAIGAVRVQEAVPLFILLCLAAFALVLLMNRLTIYLSVVAVVLAATYPFMKRYTHLPQVYLGVAFGWAVPMAFAAQTGSVPAIGWLIFLSAVIWAGIYDTEYAMVDRDDDLRIGLKSTATLLGRHDRVAIGLLQLLMTALLVWIGVLVHLGLVFWLALILATLLFGYQQYLIRDRRRTECFRAFLNNNIYGGVIFMGIALHYLSS
ncbi:MAG: 4-hydroxybenzoate octaprenyltransferase [Nitrococcus mobilis]|nr:4-hydroxybenzoate octaprenyltransferase [Nitrococcus mobilis]